jgi:hypothetical protein
MGLKEDLRIISAHNPHYEEPQLVQLVALQELHEDPCELENPSSLLWLKVERNFFACHAVIFKDRHGCLRIRCQCTIPI